MYMPPAFEEHRLSVKHDVIRAHPLALLVTHGPEGLDANLVPFLIDPAGSELGTLRAHIARANGQAAALAAGAECLVVFQGPQAYVTPSWYASKQEHGRVVPTWNYVTVHAWGRPRLIEDAAWLRRQVDDLTETREAARPAPWAVSDAPEPFVAAQLRGIVGVEIPVSRMLGKWKVSQNRPAADRHGVIEGLRGGSQPEEAMAAQVAERSDAAEAVAGRSS